MGAFTQTIETESSSEPSRRVTTRTTDEVPSRIGGNVLETVRRLLEAGRPADAESLLGSVPRTPEVRNLLGLCALRRSRIDTAINIYRSLCLVPGTVVLRPEVPIEWHVNYATALLLDGNILGTVAILGELRAEDDERVQDLRATIRHWESSLTHWQWLCWRLGTQPEVPIMFGSPQHASSDAPTSSSSPRTGTLNGPRAA